jgi:hypothetical protein
MTPHSAGFRTGLLVGGVIAYLAALTRSTD